MIRYLLSFVLLAPVLMAADAPQDHALIVYGKGFVFGVNEPIGWHGDEDAAAGYHVNMVFFPADKASRRADVTLRIRVSKKVDEDTAADLKADMDGYRREYPKVQFGELPIEHPAFTVFPKVFFIPGQFYEYIAYLNPGPKTPFIFSVAMSVQGRPATEAELAALKTVAKSLVVLDMPFEEALAIAQRNEASAVGAKYDDAVGAEFSRRHADTLAQCANGVDASELAAFDLLMQLSSNGRVEKTMALPLTIVAKCIAGSVVDDEYPHPPDGHYWVRVHLKIAP